LPVFQLANIVVTTIQTTRANHARDFILQNDLSEYDGLICIGGDGMFAELCHGLLLRTINETQRNINEPEVNLVQPHLRIGIIPAGSTDAIVFGTTGLNDPITSALQIIVGESLSIDIATVRDHLLEFASHLFSLRFTTNVVSIDSWRRC
jgi:ceramide kinase